MFAWTSGFHNPLAHTHFNIFVDEWTSANESPECIKMLCFPQCFMVINIFFLMWKNFSKISKLSQCYYEPVLGFNRTEPRPEQGSEQYRENRSWFLSWDQCECFLCSSIIPSHCINLCKVP